MNAILPFFSEKAMEGMTFALMNKLIKDIKKEVQKHAKYSNLWDIHVHVLVPLSPRNDMSVLLPASGDFWDVWYVNVKGWEVK